MSASPSKHFDPTDAPNINALWTQLAFAEWSRLGLSLAVVCPGSRSAPLAYAISRNPRIESIIAHDERSAGFVALGAARATGRAAVVVTTSGTAVANLLPAVVEASKTGTPMLLVTADRPPELHDCGANQSIHQSHIFGAFARWSIDVPCADAAIAPHWILSTADEAWRRAHSPSQSAGPVHLNWMFREPLAPRIETWKRDSVSDLSEWARSQEPWRLAIDGGVSWEETINGLIDRIRTSSKDAHRVLLCVGALYSPAMRALAQQLAKRLGCAVLADIGSGLRHGDCRGDVIAHADLVALSPEMLSALRPDFILRFGGAISSRRIGEFLTQARRSGAREMIIRDGPERMDFEHAASIELSIDTNFSSIIRAQTSVASNTAIKATVVMKSIYADAWKSADATVASVLDARLEELEEVLDEPSTARIISAGCPSGTTLLVGNSMPIRDADMHAAGVKSSPTIAVNRGASGIDGLIATAVGHARVTGAPTVAFVGDISLLHDLGSLALVSVSTVPLIIVVVNNDGGGIFHFLPLADHPNMLEPWTTAPHGLNFSAAAKMFGLHYNSPTIRGDLVNDLAEAFMRAANLSKSTLIEVQTNRFENVDFHRLLQGEIIAALNLSSLVTQSTAEVNNQ